MTLTKFNAIAFKTICVLMCVYLVVGAITIGMRHLYVKACIGLVAAAIIGLFTSSKPSALSWLLISFTLLLAMYIVGTIGQR